MKERAIIFNGEMVRAILEGRKTQTRRIVKVQPVFLDNDSKQEDRHISFEERKKLFTRRWGTHEIGDRLWVRETFARGYDYDNLQSKLTGEEKTFYRADNEIHHWLDGCGPDKNEVPWNPSIFMRKEYSRITLEITNVRVERLQDISEEDAEAEGITIPEFYPPVLGSFGCIPNANGIANYRPAFGEFDPYRFHFHNLWNSIYKNWNSNPWVWVIEFKVVKK